MALDLCGTFKQNLSGDQVRSLLFEMGIQVGLDFDPVPREELVAGKIKHTSIVYRTTEADNPEHFRGLEFKSPTPSYNEGFLDESSIFGNIQEYLIANPQVDTVF